MNKEENKMLLPKQGTNQNENNCFTALSLKMKILCLVFGVAIGVIGFIVYFSVSPYPLHASCRVEWTFGRSCQDVQGALINQMNLWKTGDNCGTGQKCLYTYLSSTSTSLKGVHRISVNRRARYCYDPIICYRYVDDIEYTFTSGPDNTCFVKGFSSSRLPSAVLDYGTNYCNIKNLVNGANLEANDSKYSESTRDAVCTQYSSANCEVY